MPHRLVDAEALTARAYLPFGEVIAVRPGLASVPANQGTSRRFDHLCRMENLRPETARLNVCLFRTRTSSRNPLPLRRLERHPCSTQTFAPLAGSGGFLVVVAQGGKSPDLATLRAFLAEGAIAISYRPGVWHHPLIALQPPDGTADFLCHVYEEDADLFPENRNTIEWGDPAGVLRGMGVRIG